MSIARFETLIGVNILCKTSFERLLKDLRVKSSFKAQISQINAQII